MTKRFVETMTALTAAALLAVPASAQIDAGRKGGIEKARDKKVAELPTCTKPIGTLAVGEPENRWWVDLGLGSPEALLRVYAQKSGCFKLVNRSQRGMPPCSRNARWPLAANCAAAAPSARARWWKPNTR